MSHFFRLALTFLLLLAVLMECIQVVMRYIFSMPVLWLNETLAFPAIWLYMLGFANAAREDSQITAKILPALFPTPLVMAISDFCARFFSFVISVWLTWHAGQYFIYSLEAGRKTGFLFVPIWIGETAIAAGMLLATWYCLIHFFRSLGMLGRLCGKGNPG